MSSFSRHSLAWCLALGLCTLAWVARSQDASPTTTAAEPSLAPSVAATKKAQGTSTSATHQFVVHGADLSVRSAFCQLSEETSSALGRLLKDNARFAIPVVVVLKTPPDVSQTEPVVSTSISQLTHGGFHLQVTAQLRADFHTESYSRELVRVLLAERILRDHQELSTSRQRVLPDWLLTGVTQAMEFRSRTRPSVLFAAVFRSGQVYSIDNILSADPQQLDALSRGIYEVSSCALVLALLEQPDASVRFSKFLTALASSNTPDRALLQQHFPTLGVSKNSLEKWWTLQMATLSTPTAMETMTVADTEKALDKALVLRFEEKESGREKKSGRRAQPTVQPKPVTVADVPQEEKKSGRFFGFGRNKADKKEVETEEKVKTQPEPTVEAQPSAPAPAVAAPTPPPVEKAKPEAKAEPKPKAAPAPNLEKDKPGASESKQNPAKAKEKEKEEPSADKPKEGKSLFQNLNPFGGGRKVIFPFDKKKKEGDLDSDKPADAKVRIVRPGQSNATPREAPVPEKPKADKPSQEDTTAGSKKAATKETPAPAAGKPEADKPAAKEKMKPVKAAAKESPAAERTKVETPVVKESTPSKTEVTATPEIKSLPRKSNATRSVSRQPDMVSAGPKPGPDSAQNNPPTPTNLPQIPSLSPKPAGTRSVGAHPDDLPAVLPPLAPAESDAEKANLMNPINWFRKDGAPTSEGMPFPGAPPTESSPGVAGASIPDGNARPQLSADEFPLEEFTRLAKREDRIKILQRTVEQLSALSLRAHPLYKQLLSGYIGVLQKMIQGKDKEVLGELATLNAERAKIREKAVAVESYLDWYEASEIHTYSGTFDDYIKLRRKMESEIRPRSDAISKYLDTLEKEYE